MTPLQQPIDCLAYYPNGGREAMGQQAIMTKPGLWRRESDSSSLKLLVRAADL